MVLILRVLSRATEELAWYDEYTPNSALVCGAIPQSIGSDLVDAIKYLYLTTAITVVSLQNEGGVFSADFRAGSKVGLALCRLIRSSQLPIRRRGHLQELFLSDKALVRFTEATQELRR